MRGSVHDRAIALRDVVLTRDDSRLAALLSEMESLKSDYATASEGEHRVTSQYPSGQEELSILASIDAQGDTTLELTQQVIDARQADQFADAETLLLEQAGPAYAEWLNRINQFINLQQQFREFCLRIGITKQENMVEMGMLEACIRDDLGSRGCRV